MHPITFLAMAIFFLAGSSASADSRRFLTTAHVRSLGMDAVLKAQLKVNETRKLQHDETNLGDANMEDILAAAAPMFCAEIESAIAPEELYGEGIVCSEFGCDNPEAATPNLIMNCKMDSEICDADNQFCAKDTEIKMTMGLTFVGKSKVTTTECTSYTKPQNLADLGRECLSVDFTMDMGALINAGISGEQLDEDTVLDYLQLESCSSKFEDGTECECGFCNGGSGFELKCNNNLVSEECTDLYLGFTDALAGGKAADPGVSVVKFVDTHDAVITPAEGEMSDTDKESGTEEADVTSPAAFHTVAAPLAGIIMAFSTLQALM